MYIYIYIDICALTNTACHCICLTAMVEYAWWSRPAAKGRPCSQPDQGVPGSEQPVAPGFWTTVKTHSTKRSPLRNWYGRRAHLIGLPWLYPSCNHNTSSRMAVCHSWMSTADYLAIVTRCMVQLPVNIHTILVTPVHWIGRWEKLQETMVRSETMIIITIITYHY